MKSTIIKKGNTDNFKANEILTMAQGGNYFAFQIKEDLIINRFNQEDAEIEEFHWSYRLGPDEKKISFSPSGRYLLEQNKTGEKIKLINVAERKVIFQHDSTAKVNASTFVLHANKEFFVFTPAPYQLQILDLSTMKVVFNDDTSSSIRYSYAQLQAMHSADIIIGLGYMKGESIDTLFAFSFSKTINEKNGLHFIQELSDYAYVFKFGAADKDIVIVYRDPEDSENEDGETDENLLYNFKGFYSRQLKTHNILNKIPFELEISKLNGFFMTNESIIIGMNNGIKLISIGELPIVNDIWFETNAYCFNTVDQLIIMISEENKLEMILLNK